MNHNLVIDFKLFTNFLFFIFKFIRSYISFDILRRVLADYFNYNIFYVMNITDIDDKIIKRARQNYLYDKYVAENHPLDQLLADHDAVLVEFNEVVAKNTDADKKTLLDKILQQ